MKKILLLIIAAFSVTFLLTGCLTSRYPTFRQTPMISDFRVYADSGFVISPGLDGYKYKPIGLVSVVFYPGHVTEWRKTKLEAIKEGKDTSCFSIAVPIDITKEGNFQPAEEYLLSRMVSLVRNLGGNGLLNLEISYRFDFYPEEIAEAHNEGCYLKKFSEQRYVAAIVSGFAVEITE